MLDEARIFYDESSVREGYHLIRAVVPGQRWEIEVSDEGEIEFEIFRSGGNLFGKDVLSKEVRRFAER